MAKVLIVEDNPANMTLAVFLRNASGGCVTQAVMSDDTTHAPGRSDVADRTARMLIVDNERHNRQVLEVMLAPEGFLLQTAASGFEPTDGFY